MRVTPGFSRGRPRGRRQAALGIASPAHAADGPTIRTMNIGKYKRNFIFTSLRRQRGFIRAKALSTKAFCCELEHVVRLMGRKTNAYFKSTCWAEAVNLVRRKSCYCPDQYLLNPS